MSSSPLLLCLAVGFAGWLAWRFAGTLRQDAHRLHRIDRGQCPDCGHDLAGGGGACAGCGRPFRPFEAVKICPGVCPCCGYDLRASPEQCPECGTVAAR